VYNAALISDKWGRWRDDWVIVQAEVHDWLELPTAISMGSCSSWDKVPNPLQAYRPVIKRIQFLA
jgi:hypothetical protein